MGVELSVILAYAVGLILLYLVGWFLVIPIKIIIRLVWNGIIGGIMLFLFNLVGGFFNITVVINPLTALIAGFLGVPGVILLIIFNYMI